MRAWGSVVAVVVMVAFAGCTGEKGAKRSEATGLEPDPPMAAPGPAMNFTDALARARTNASARLEVRPFDLSGSVRPMVEAGGQRAGPCVGPNEAPINATRCYTVLEVPIDGVAHWANLTLEWTGAPDLAVTFGPATSPGAQYSFYEDAVEANGPPPLALQWLGPNGNATFLAIQVGFDAADGPLALHQQTAFRAYGEVAVAT